jgi:hypothetical protein
MSGVGVGAGPQAERINTMAKNNPSFFMKAFILCIKSPAEFCGTQFF